MPPGIVLNGFKALPLPVEQLCLSAVLKCGQSFRWKAHLANETFSDKSDSEKFDVPNNDLFKFEYRFCVKDRVVCLRQSSDTLFYKALFPDEVNNASSSTDSASREAARDQETLAFIRDYFQLDIDLKLLYDDWKRRDPVFRKVQDRFAGIRMLKQDPWECLVSFICSSNNNISRITKMVENLCTHFSPPLLARDNQDSGVYHAFPPPSSLSPSSVASTLRSLGFGYRADFIQKTAAMLLEEHQSDEGVSKFLHGLRETDTPDARAELVKLMGVGRKVADCVLLMSMNKPEVVPVDTHVHQIAVKHYGMNGKGKMTMSPKLYDEVNDRLTKVWGPYAGWAHSVLFTADLKAFATYGLPTPSQTPQLSTPIHSELLLKNPKLTKRRRKGSSGGDLSETLVEVVKVEHVEGSFEEGESGLAERVKRRRRMTASTAMSIKIKS